jgi:hypothetical protein
VTDSVPEDDGPQKHYKRFEGTEKHDEYLKQNTKNMEILALLQANGGQMDATTYMQVMIETLIEFLVGDEENINRLMLAIMFDRKMREMVLQPALDQMQETLTRATILAGTGIEADKKIVVPGQ